MKCPACHYKDTKVLDSRVINEGLAIRRRRECLKCDFRFSTKEETEILDMVVVKRDGKREAYSRDKLERGLRKSLEKRPITQDEFHRLVNKIERDIQVKKKGEIKSSDVGEIVMKHLKKQDQIAYIRFASVYRSFEDAKILQKELNDLLKKKRKK